MRITGSTYNICNNTRKAPAFKSLIFPDDNIFFNPFQRKQKQQINEELLQRMLDNIAMPSLYRDALKSVKIKPLQVLNHEHSEKQTEIARQDITAELKKAEEEKSRNQQEIECKSAQFIPSCSFLNCDLSDEQKKLIIENVFSPIKVKDKYNGEAVIPNGILFVGKDQEKMNSYSVIIADEFNYHNIYGENFVLIDNVSDEKEFEEWMNEAKKEAKAKFEKSPDGDKKTRTVIFLEDFEKFAPSVNSGMYNSSRSCFLKNYFLDCADNGCMIIATTKNKESIDDPFIINKKRFGLVIEL